MSETLPLAEVKAKLSEMVDRVEHTHDRITLTRHGRPAAVLISPDELASLEDTLELLSDPEAMAQVRASRAAHEAGDYVTGDELRHLPGAVTEGSDDAYDLRVTGPAQRQLGGLPEGVATAIVEFMLGPLLVAPRRVGGRLQRELAGMRSAPGSYRIVYEIDDELAVVIVHRIEHRATVYRPR